MKNFLRVFLSLAFVMFFVNVSYSATVDKDADKHYVITDVDVGEFMVTNTISQNVIFHTVDVGINCEKINIIINRQLESVFIIEKMKLWKFENVPLNYIKGTIKENLYYPKGTPKTLNVFTSSGGLAG